MKYIILILILVSTLSCNATSCFPVFYDAGDQIAIIKNGDSPQLYFSIPAVLKDSTLESIYLRGYSLDENNKSSQLLVPIAFEVTDKKAKAQLWMLPNFINVRIEAKYGKGRCGLRVHRIYKNVSI